MEHFNLFYPYTITTADADMEGRLKPGALVNYLVQSAIRSAEELGFGFAVLEQQQIFWVLHRLTVEVDRILHWNERLTVETWPKDIDGLLYLRDFLVRDESESIVARATSGWLAINRTSKRPGKVSTLYPEKFSALKETHAIRELPLKLDSTVTGDSLRLHPVFSDFDINHHVTSSRYIDWMTDALPWDIQKNRYPAALSVNFLKEILPGDVIRMNHLQMGEENCFDATKEPSGTPAFRGKIVMREGNNS